VPLQCFRIKRHFNIDIISKVPNFLPTCALGFRQCASGIGRDSVGIADPKDPNQAVRIEHIPDLAAAYNEPVDTCLWSPRRHHKAQFATIGESKTAAQHVTYSSRKKYHIQLKLVEFYEHEEMKDLADLS
jgi:hypothetical protein